MAYLWKHKCDFSMLPVYLCYTVQNMATFNFVLLLPLAITQIGNALLELVNNYSILYSLIGARKTSVNMDYAYLRLRGSYEDF